MRPRTFLTLLTLGGISAGILTVAFVFARSWLPSDRARGGDQFVLSMDEIPVGKVVRFEVFERPLFVFRPDAQQSLAIQQMDMHVWHRERDSYVDGLRGYVYWGISTRFWPGCKVSEKPPLLRWWLLSRTIATLAG